MEKLIREAREMEKAGACAIVLELVDAEASAEITKSVDVPTIGIGAGKGTTGQIRVTHDLLGLTPWFKPGFVKKDLGVALAGKSEGLRGVAGEGLPGQREGENEGSRLGGERGAAFQDRGA